MGNIASTGKNTETNSYAAELGIDYVPISLDPPETKTSIKLEPFEDEMDGGDGAGANDEETAQQINTRKTIEEANTLYERLKTNIEMYSIYDNYDSKNEVILTDLKKKELNQATELKQLNEDRDKLKVVLDYDKNKSSKYVQGTTTIGRINILLLLVLIACIVLIIYRILTHPYGLIDITKVRVEELEKITTNDLEQLSIGELDELDDILEQKIEELEMKQDSNSKYNNNLNSNSVNITRSNLDKKTTFTLSNSNNIISNKNNRRSRNKL